MPFQHFIKHLEKQRASKTQQNIQPSWISGFVDQIADLFVPLNSDGRVGYDCKMNERGWKIIMFLGSTEYVGGRHDGYAHHSNFEINLSDIHSIYENIDVLKWETYPDSTDPDNYQNHSKLIVEGVSSGEFIQLELHSVPPNEMGPGFKQFPNGQRAIV